MSNRQIQVSGEEMMDMEDGKGQTGMDESGGKSEWGGVERATLSLMMEEGQSYSTAERI